jgi:dihydroorotate dehydrogenase
MYALLQPLLFCMDAERAHTLALSALKAIPSWCMPKVTGHTVRAMGLEFPHPIGLAAGLDKDGQYLDGLAKLHWGFIELGTVTPKPQSGNPKPRLFRVPKAEGIINRMGFNNQGVDALVSRVEHARYKGILGINIGKNKDTPLNGAADDYLHCLQRVYPLASYVTINISSPNTPDLRQLQQEGYFADLLSQLHRKQQVLTDALGRYVPLVVKVSPDESEETLKQMTDVILKYDIQGIIATNTTCSREMIEGLPWAQEIGGLSGKPLRDKSTQCLRLLKQYVGDAVTLIGVGGIDSVESAQEKLNAGATLLQVYSGLIYKGPKLVAQLAQGLAP